MAYPVHLLAGKQDFRRKTTDLEAHNPQRLRWFGEQYYNALYHARDLVASAFRYRRLAAFDYLLTLWRPPRSLQVVITPMLARRVDWLYSYAYLVFWISVANHLSHLHGSFCSPCLSDHGKTVVESIVVFSRSAQTGHPQRMECRAQYPQREPRQVCSYHP